MLEDEDDDDEDDDDDDKDDDEVEGKFTVNVVCCRIHVSFFFFPFLVFMHSHLFLLSQWAFFQVTHHLSTRMWRRVRSVFKKAHLLDVIDNQ